MTKRKNDENTDILQNTPQNLRLKIFSWNINGIDHANKKKFSKLNNFLHQNYGIHMLQEIHLPNDITIDKMQSKNYRFFLNGGTDHSAGVALHIPVPDSQILTYTDSSINRHDFNSRIITCRINWCNQPITLVNIYAPATSSKQRTSFFKELEATLENLPGPYILGGDFNCVLDPNIDTFNYKAKPNSMNCTDQVSLTDLTIKFNLHDVWRRFHPHEIVGTFARNAHKTSSNANKTSRLDRFYVSESLVPIIESCRIEFNDSSDHHPVSLTLLSPDEYQVFRPAWRLNAHLLTNKDYLTYTKNYLSTFIEKNPIVTIESYTRLKLILKAKAKKHTIGLRVNTKKVISNLKDQLEDLTYLQYDPNIQKNPTLQLLHATEIAEVKRQLQLKEQILNSSTMKKIELNRAENYEEMTKYFFNSPTLKQFRTVMTSITYNEKTVRLQHEKAEAACSFYKDLYEKRSTSNEAKKRLLKTITNSFSSDSKEYKEMEKIFSQEEIFTVLKKLPKSKSPGPDGLICELYSAFKEEFSIILTRLFNFCIENNNIPQQMQEANIHLLFKKGDTDNLANWRPISLLDTDYKILSSTLNNRLKSHLKHMIHSDQKGFVPTRKLDDAVLKTTHLINYCKRENIPAYLLFLDQEKAFDRVDRQYLFDVIDRYNIPPTITSLIKCIYAKTLARISINNQLSLPIELMSGVRQGCPLSPTLFVMCIEPLANMVRAHKHYKGLIYPQIKEPLKISMFADDTFFIIKNQKDHDTALKLISIYEKGTGAKANVSKTEILPIGPNTHNTENSLTTSIKILEYDQEVRLLGVNISNKSTSDLVWPATQQRLITVLKKWSAVKLSLRGRILVSKTVVVPIIHFQSKFHTLTNTYFKIFQRLIWNFIKINDPKHVSLETAQLPLSLGGLNAPNLIATTQAARLNWFKELLSQDNPCEWKIMALQELDVISNTKGMGVEILLHPILIPKNKHLSFWRENLSIFHKCGGQIETTNPFDTINELKINATMSKLATMPLKNITPDIKTLTKHDITKLSDFIDQVTPEGKILPITHTEFKQRHNLKRNISKRKFEQIISILPEAVNAPTFFKLPDDENYFILDESLPEPHAKRLKQCPLRDNTYEPSEEPSQIITNIPNLVELNHTLTIDKYHKIEGEKNYIQKITTANTKITLKIGDEKIFLQKINSSSLALAFSKQKQKYHKHALIWDNLFPVDTVEYHKFPNRRQHPSLPKYLYNLRYYTLHNKHWIGEKLKYLPEAKPEDMLCKQCNSTNSITHLIALCNHIKPLWQDLETIYNELTTIIPDECKFPIKEEYFYFGPPTMPSRRQNLGKVQFQILDILIGNLQLAIFANYNLTSRNSNSANPQSNLNTVKQIWHLNMSRSTNAIINSSNKQRSISVWTFRSNKILPSTTIKTWIPSFLALTSDTILSLSH